MLLQTTTNSRMTDWWIDHPNIRFNRKASVLSAERDDIIFVYRGLHSCPTLGPIRSNDAVPDTGCNCIKFTEACNSNDSNFSGKLDHMCPSGKLTRELIVHMFMHNPASTSMPTCALRDSTGLIRHTLHPFDRCTTSAGDMVRLNAAALRSSFAKIEDTICHIGNVLRMENPDRLVRDCFTVKRPTLSNYNGKVLMETAYELMGAISLLLRSRFQSTSIKLIRKKNMQAARRQS